MAAVDGSIRIDTRIDEKGFNAGVSSMMAGVKRLAIAIGAIFGAKLAAQAAAGIVKLAAEFQRLELAALAVGRMFGYTDDQVRTLVADLVDMGIQSNIANKAFINFAREGLDTSLLPALARGAQDLNVFAEAGATSSDVLDRLLNGILTLQPEVLRTAGVAVDLQLAFKKWAAANSTTVAQMTIQEKRQAALIAVTEKLTGVTGLYEISQQTLAGQMASNTRIVNEFKAALAGPFTGAVFTVVKAWNDLLKAFTAAIGPGGRLHGLFLNLAAAAQLLGNMIARVIAAIGALFGAKISVATQTTQAMAGATGALASATQAAADAQGDLAKETGKAAKAAKGALAPFDELNVLQQETPTAGGGAGGGGAGAEFPMPEIDPGPLQTALDAIGQRVEALKAKFAELVKPFQPTIDAVLRLWEALQPLKDFAAKGLQDFYDHFLKPVGEWVLGEGLPRFIDAITEGLQTIDWGRINDALVTLWDALAPFAINVGEGLLWLWENVLVPFAAWTISEVLPLFLEGLAAVLDILNGVIEALKPLGQWLWDEFLQPLAEWTGGVIVDVLGWLVDRLNEFSDWIEDNQTTVETIVIILGSFALAWWLVNTAVSAWAVIAGIAATATTAFGVAVAFLASPLFLIALILGIIIAVVILLIKKYGSLEAAWQQTANFIEADFENLRVFFFDTADKIARAINDAWDKIKRGAELTWGDIVKAWKGAEDWFKTKVTKPIKKWFKDQWDNLKKWTQDAWNWVVSKWQGAGTWFSTNVTTPIKNFFNNAWNAIKTYVSNAWTSAKTTWQGAKEWFRTTVTNPIRNTFSTNWATIKTKIDTVWTGVKTTWQGALTWFQETVITPVQNAFDTALTAIGGFFTTTFSGIQTTVITALNTVIAKINTMISGATNAINGLISKINSIKITIPAILGGGTIGFSISPISAPPQIPLLATGAVIPPNAAFLAMLGDQRSGRNIEAPEGLLRQLIREEMGALETSVTVRFEGRMAALVRELKPMIEAESTRIGKSLIKSGATT